MFFNRRPQTTTQLQHRQRAVVQMLGLAADRAANAALLQETNLPLTKRSLCRRQIQQMAGGKNIPPGTADVDPPLCRSLLVSMTGARQPAQALVLNDPTAFVSAAELCRAHHGQALAAKG